MFRKITLGIAAALIALAPSVAFAGKGGGHGGHGGFRGGVQSWRSWLAIMAITTATGSIVMSATACIPAVDAIGIAGSRPASGSSSVS